MVRTMRNDIPFAAAIFDLDGTLLDSTWVWRAVDEAFFAGLGIDVPEDYAPAVQGMSFRETAEYTVRRFALAETAEEVMAGWMRGTADQYARRVPMKPGALAYLRALKRAGVKLAVATANREALFEPTLRRCGAYELFDAICTSAEVGDAGKGDGTLFRLAAEKLGVAPGDCAVFEDTPEGLRGARRAGMRAYAVRDLSNARHMDEVAALADGVIGDFTEAGALHPIPPEGRCVIFTARCDGDPDRAYAPQAGDFVLCADGGWLLARQAGVKPDLVIGDFDSSDEPGDESTVRVPVEKDDTDTMLCLKKGLAMGYGDFVIVGGYGGRLDHTLANLQTLHYAAAHHARAVLCDGLTWATAIVDGAVRVPADVLGGGRTSLSVFALSDTCRGVTVRGAKYALEDGELTNAFPLGVSNSFAGDHADVEVRDGAALVMVCGK